MIGWLVRSFLKPIVGLGDRYLANQADREKLRHGTDRVVFRADSAFRQAKLATRIGRLPLFCAEMAGAAYFCAILIDSTFPMDWLTPLELPQWFKPHFHVAMASVFGIATVDRWLGKT